MRSVIFYGGKSVEHEISIISALQAYGSLKGANQDTLLVYLDKENKMYVGKELANKNTYLNWESVVKKLREVYIDFRNGPVLVYKGKRRKIIPFDVALQIVHGNNLEDGKLSSIFELYNIPYYGPSSLSGSICQDKIVTKIILTNYGIPVLPYQQVSGEIDIKLEYPLIVKPAHLGSSIGISVARNLTDLKDILPGIYLYDDKALVEPYLSSRREFNIAIMGDKEDYMVSQIEEVFANKDYLSFDDKYSQGSMVNLAKVIPAKINNKIQSLIERYAKRAYKVLECTGVVRFDFLYDKITKKVYLNEVNSIPGSLAFYLFKDMSLASLLICLQNIAIKRNEEKNQIVQVLDNKNILTREYGTKLTK